MGRACSWNKSSPIFFYPKTQHKNQVRGRYASPIVVDTHPPLLFETEKRLLLKPISFYVNCFTLPHLFAGKMHALLFRKWQKRLKGRDWYDMEWFIRNGIGLHFEHFCQRAMVNGDWPQPAITKIQLLELLHAKINSTAIENAREDVMRLYKMQWSKRFGLETILLCSWKI